MSDFLAAFPSISMNDYLWELSIPLITIMSCDKSRIDYDNDEKDNKQNVKVKNVDNAGDWLSSFGIVPN